MIIYLAGVILVVGFLFFLRLFRLVEKSREVIGIAHKSINIIRDKDLDDYQKEVAMQKNAKQLLLHFLLITAGSIAAIAIPFFIVFIMELAGILTIDKVISSTMTLEFIIGTLIVSIGYFFYVWRK